LHEVAFESDARLGLPPEEVELLIGQPLAQLIGVEMPLRQRVLGYLAG
jgi:hypothetical protein